MYHSSSKLIFHHRYMWDYIYSLGLEIPPTSLKKKKKSGLNKDVLFSGLKKQKKKPCMVSSRKDNLSKDLKNCHRFVFKHGGELFVFALFSVCNSTHFKCFRRPTKRRAILEGGG